MMSPDGHLSTASSCVRRWLRRRRHAPCILFAVLVVGLSIQVYISRPEREYLELPVPTEEDVLVVRDFWGGSEQQDDQDISSSASKAPPDQGDTDELPPPPQTGEQPLKSWSLLSRRSCDPKSHVVFLKTHKTASSTIQNILYRYGESGNLTFALPRNKHNQLAYPIYFNTRFVEGVVSNQTKHFDILCNHMRFRKSEVKKLMPEDSFYFSILRHPVAMMESIFTYYKGLGVFKWSNTLDDFISNNSIISSIATLRNNYAHNNLAFDFGYDNTPTAESDDLEERASEVIAGIEEDFHLILISEYFDESMILLKRALCWSLEDVVSFKLNSRSDQTRKPPPASTAERIKEWNVLDWKLYLHFNATFWRYVKSVVGEEEMKREVSELRQLQAKITSVCLESEQAVNPRLIKDAGLKPFQYGRAVIQGYLLKAGLSAQVRAACERFITPELQYTVRLYDRQFPPKPERNSNQTRSDLHSSKDNTKQRSRSLHLKGLGQDRV